MNKARKTPTVSKIWIPLKAVSRWHFLLEKKTCENASMTKQTVLIWIIYHICICYLWAYRKFSRECRYGLSSSMANPISEDWFMMLLGLSVPNFDKYRIIGLNYASFSTISTWIIDWIKKYWVNDESPMSQFGRGFLIRGRSN